MRVHDRTERVRGLVELPAPLAPRLAGAALDPVEVRSLVSDRGVDIPQGVAAGIREQRVPGEHLPQLDLGGEASLEVLGLPAHLEAPDVAQHLDHPARGGRHRGTVPTAVRGGFSSVDRVPRDLTGVVEAVGAQILGVVTR